MRYLPEGYRIGALCLTTAALVTACSGGGEPAAETRPRAAPINQPLVATHDGGLYVLDGETLELAQDIPLDGFLRVNPAGDDSHVLVTTSEGFRILDAAAGQLTEGIFPAEDAGHVVNHGEHTVLFDDGTGEITAFDPHALADGTPQTETFTAPRPHHGVAVILSDGTLAHSIGDTENRNGAVAVRDGREIARSEECPGIHGESVAADEVVVLGCENGVLEFAGGAFTKIPSPTPYGRTGNTRGHDDSPIVLGDMKIDPDAEMERPNRFALIDTTTDRLEVMSLPPSVSYWFRSLGRGPQAEALIMGTDGTLYVFDPVTGAQVKAIKVTEPWTEPDDWQQPGPAVFTRDDSVYVSDPAARQIHVVDLAAGAVRTSASLPQPPNELSGAVGHRH
ncbi:zinc metallochaperone AztD [Mycolicibacterium sp. F2034L]|uniref:zinc metallochaperone AztD n=1 Tax=Mycolicibacterium sp. F2034L TaxID=2926422 RepID=UPI001FF21FE9|nr:zinc metallochaperone AztD [Mycolicibacterium sp. F2034L]MCK0176865.1 hypothetical protein [Mycolicibacterium sp. F2034L]